MAEKFDQNKYTRKYNEEHYSRIELKVAPEIKQELQRKAKESGLSLTAFIVKSCLPDETE